VAEISATGGRWYEAEVQRLKGDLLLTAGRPDVDAITCYETALAVAARQGAQLWERRAADALAELRRPHGATRVAVDVTDAARHGST
jgi:hypothetical protein